jgi:hypothetical protein
MSDIVERLRKWCHAPNAASAQDIMDEAADEIERLRSGGACPHVRGTVTQHCSLNFTLTAAEREAIEFFVGFHNDGYGLIEKHAATLRKMLERLA